MTPNSIPMPSGNTWLSDIVSSRERPSGRNEGDSSLRPRLVREEVSSRSTDQRTGTAKDPLPGLDRAGTEVLDATLTVRVVGVETGRTVLLVERDGAFLHVAPADDPRAIGLVTRGLPMIGITTVPIGATGPLVLPTRLPDPRAQKPVHASPIDHASGRGSAHKESSPIPFRFVLPRWRVRAVEGPQRW